MNNSQKTVFIAASGSGGHILPALVLAQEWHAKNPNGQIIFFSSRKNLDQKILAQHEFLTKVITLNFDAFSIKKFWLIPKILVQIMGSLCKSFYYAFLYKPEKVITTGGLIAIPVSIATRLTGHAVEVTELNVVPGKAIRFLLPIASKVFITFEQTKKLCSFLGKSFAHKCQTKAYPVRFEAQDRHYNQQEIIARLPGFSSTRKTIFLLGGSQGSVFLNTHLKKFLQGHSEIHEHIQIIHQAGSQDKTDWQAFYKNLAIPAIAFAYHEKIKDFYQCADLIICRAGAGTLFEIEFFKKKCLVIPLITDSTTHQVENACAMAKKYPDRFIMIDQDSVAHSPTLFSSAILDCLKI
jgi:UDP-N-acetylglucosamine--N-acetylmuramyl-(pentapeptide) pyrophosphoryl-undecaprenol N-acetylglucosamine transferase